MANIKLTIQYDGTFYSGWQKQENAIGIENILEDALEKIVGKRTKLVGAGRTDKGVHAYGQVANFKTDAKIRPDKYPYWFKVYLPDDIKVIKSEEVPDDFHARFSAKSKTYLYKIYNSDDMHPIFRNFYEEITYDLDLERMKDAAKILIGKHDFSAFSGILEEKTNPVRTIEDIDLRKSDFGFEIEIKGESFLRNQVRIIAGSLVEVGRGKMSKKDLEKALLTLNRKDAGPTLSGKGLYLMGVYY